MVSVRYCQVALSAIATRCLWLLQKNVNTYITENLLMDLWRIAMQKMSTYSSHIMYIMYMYMHAITCIFYYSQILRNETYAIDMYYMNALPTHTHTHTHTHTCTHNTIPANHPEFSGNIPEFGGHSRYTGDLQ